MSSAASPNVHTIIYIMCRHSRLRGGHAGTPVNGLPYRHLPQPDPRRKVWVRPMEKNGEDNLRLGTNMSQVYS